MFRDSLQGTGSLDLRGARMRIEAELTSPRVQIDDFVAESDEPAESAEDEAPAEDRALEGIQRDVEPAGFESARPDRRGVYQAGPRG